MSDLDLSVRTLEGRADAHAARLSLESPPIPWRAERSRCQHRLGVVSGGYLEGGVREPMVDKAWTAVS